MIYELHITTDPTVDVDVWKLTCGQLGVKPLVIELENGDHPRQVMTASVFEGDDDQAESWVSLTKAMIERDGFPVRRIKLEVPLDKSAPYQDPAYYEAHVKCLLRPEEVTANLTEAASNGWVASRNGLFVSDHGLEKWYLTKRAYRCGFIAAGEYLTQSFALMNLQGTVRMEKETVLSDSLPSLDDGWVL